MKKCHRNRILIVGIILVCLSGVGYFVYGYLDIDGDGLTNNEEKKYHTDPNNPVTSGDGILDGKAIELGLNPAQSYPLVGYGYEKGLEDAVLKELADISDNQNAHFFVGYLTKLNNSSAEYLAHNFLEDNKLNTAESNQI